MLSEGPITGYRDALERAGIEAALGEGLCIGINFHLADSKDSLPLPKPSLSPIAIDSLAGALPCEHTKEVTREYFLPGT